MEGWAVEDEDAVVGDELFVCVMIAVPLHSRLHVCPHHQSLEWCVHCCATDSTTAVLCVTMTTSAGRWVRCLLMTGDRQETRRLLLLLLAHRLTESDVRDETCLRVMSRSVRCVRTVGRAAFQNYFGAPVHRTVRLASFADQLMSETVNKPVV